MKVYFETSSLGFYFDDRSPRERDAVRALVRRVSRGDLEGFVSDLVLAEIQAAHEPLRSRLLRLTTPPAGIGGSHNERAP
jgi:predicted nucleic acid-binding protein